MSYAKTLSRYKYSNCINIRNWSRRKYIRQHQNIAYPTECSKSNVANQNQIFIIRYYAEACTRGGVHIHVLEPEQHSSGKTLQQWRPFADPVSNWTNSRIKPIRTAQRMVYDNNYFCQLIRNPDLFSVSVKAIRRTVIFERRKRVSRNTRLLLFDQSKPAVPTLPVKAYITTTMADPES